MRKLNSNILTFALIFIVLSGCGMPGPLYQEEQKNQEINSTEHNSLSAQKENQEN